MSSVADVERVIRELLSSYFAEHALPMPTIKLVQKIGAKYLARCSWRPGADNTTIEVQRQAAGDPATLRRVLAHELIHHWEFLRTDQSRAMLYARMGIKDDGHGDAFFEYAERINAKAGPGYVTKTSDQDYDTSKAPPFYILVEPHGRNGDRYGFTIAIKPSAVQRAVIADKRVKNLAKLFHITDGRFLNGAPIKRLGGYSIPQNADVVEALRTLYLTGKEIT